MVSKDSIEGYICVLPALMKLDFDMKKKSAKSSIPFLEDEKITNLYCIIGFS
jgi:hypothetical protein